MSRNEMNDQITEHESSCAKARRAAFWKGVCWTAGVLGFLITTAIAIIQPVTARALQKIENDAIQDTKIANIERQQDALQRDIAEIKADIKTLLQRERSK